MFINRTTYPRTAIFYKYVDKNIWENKGIELPCTEINKKTTRVYNPVNNLTALEESFTIETPKTLDYQPYDHIVFEGRTYSISEVSYEYLYKQRHTTFKNEELRVYTLTLEA